jgi:hypothetical protein
MSSDRERVLEDKIDRLAKKIEELTALIMAGDARRGI